MRETFYWWFVFGDPTRFALVFVSLICAVTYFAIRHLWRRWTGYKEPRPKPHRWGWRKNKQKLHK